MRATRITETLSNIMVLIIGRSAMGRWTSVSDLLEMGGQGAALRGAVNNALAAAMKHGLLERSETRPYKYRMRDGLDENNRQFVEEIQQRWIEDRGASVPKTLDDVTGLIAKNVGVTTAPITIEGGGRVSLPFTAAHFEVAGKKEKSSVVVEFKLSPNTAKWLRDNVTGEWRIEPDFAHCDFIFQTERDATLFKLFCG